MEKSTPTVFSSFFRVTHLPLWIGLRYNRSSNKQRFLSLLSWVSLVGMMLGVAALIIVLSVMNGFQSELRDRMLGLMAHGKIESSLTTPLADWQSLAQWLSVQENIVAVAPLVGGDVMLSANNRLKAAQLNGIDWSAEQSIAKLGQHIVRGDAAEFESSPYGIILGRSLAYSLGVDIGDKVSVVLPKITVTPFGVKPRIKQFTLLALFEVGADMDTTHAYIRLQDGQRLYGFKRKGQAQVSAIRYLTADVLQADRHAQRLSKSLAIADDTALKNIAVIPWSQERLHLFQAVKMEKMMVTFMLSMVIAVAAFNLISVLSMMVADKRNEISVLRMMGLSSFSVLLVFLTQGLSLTLVSVLIGGAIGSITALYLSEFVVLLEQTFGFYIFDPSVFYISGLPSDLQMADVLYVVLVSFILSFLFILYPAYRATQIKAVEALQYQ